jgi:adenylosuccinate lyase
MPTSAIDSLIFGNIFGSAEMREVWSDGFRTQKYLDWEAALARAEASVGIISKEAAAEITFAGRLPQEVELFTRYSAAVAKRSKQPDLAKQLVQYIASDIQPTREKMGLEPPQL